MKQETLQKEHSQVKISAEQEYLNRSLIEGVASFFTTKEQVLQKLKTGADPNWYDEKGFSALTTTILLNQKEFFNTLFENGADLNACNQRGFSVLSFCFLLGTTDYFEKVLNSGADLEKTNQYGESVIEMMRKHTCDSKQQNLLRMAEEHLEKMKNRNLKPSVYTGTVAGALFRGKNR